MKLAIANALSLTIFLAGAGCGASMGTSEVRPAEPAKAAAKTVAQASLYDRLGGERAITVVVDDFVANLLADDAIKFRFRDTDAVSFKAKLVEQICEATGGPCKYTGKSMRDSHAGMKISDAEFAALVTDLKKALDKNKVPDREQKELLGALGGMHDDVVNL